MTAGRYAFAVGCACVALAAACREDPLTQLVVVVDSDWDGFVRARIEVDGFEEEVNVEVEPRRGRPLLPRRLALVHDGGDLGPIDVTVRGFVEGSDEPRLVEPRSGVFFERGKTRMLKIDLLYACLDKCHPGKACLAGGQCVDKDDERAIELGDWNGDVDGLHVTHRDDPIDDAGSDGGLVPPNPEGGAAGAPEPSDAGDGAVEPLDADAASPAAPFSYMPSNFDPEAADVAGAARVDVTLDCGASRFDSRSLLFVGWCDVTEPEAVVVEQSDGSEAVLLVMGSLHVASDATLQLTGDRPVILAVFGNARIAGTIDASAQGATPGPGADRDCALGAGAPGGAAGSYTGAGGGAGGGFGSVGGDGGQGGTAGAEFGIPAAAAAGGVIDGNAALVPLRGGCSGGQGGAATAGGGAGGGGGGAVQVSAAGTLTLSGTINASGGGGAAGTASRTGGGGGGSGGGIALEAAAIAIDDAAVLSANGGAGAAGQPTPSASATSGPGADGAPGIAAAAGGTPAATGGGGGDGAAAAAQAAFGSDGGVSTYYGAGGGGGGGGMGRISVGGADTCVLPGTWSPTPAIDCVDCGACPVAPAGQCEPYEHDARIYFRCNAPLDWDAANANCEAANLQLVRIDDQAENDAVALGVTEDTWIGASDMNEGDWRWSDGTAFWSGDFDGVAVDGLYNAWALGQPDNAVSALTNADCAIIGTDAAWTDRSCAISHPYVCEP